MSKQVDSIIWPRCKNGKYSVKTGYQQLCEDEGRGDEFKSFKSKDILESHMEAEFQIKLELFFGKLALKLYLLRRN